MKKSKMVSLVLISSALASCNKSKKQAHEPKVYMRSDSTAEYTPINQFHDNTHWFYAFRPYGMFFDGMYDGGYYNRYGYYSGAIHESSNLGSNGAKSSVVRGGFGHGGFSVSS